jgi:hypothetical protein
MDAGVALEQFDGRQGVLVKSRRLMRSAGSLREWLSLAVEDGLSKIFTQEIAVDDSDIEIFPRHISGIA